MDDRRQQLRLPIQLWVEESHDRAKYFQHSGNLSAGGIFLERTLPHPPGTLVRLEFQLPDDPTPVQVQAEIVSAIEEGPGLGMGLKFVGLAPELSSRIAAFVASRRS